MTTLVKSLKRRSRMKVSQAPLYCFANDISAICHTSVLAGLDAYCSLFPPYVLLEEHTQEGQMMVQAFQRPLECPLRFQQEQLDKQM